MCSISGIWRFKGSRVSQQEITSFNDVTAYRGPDGEGTFLDENANLALGHRRLSILDLSKAGKQPMFSSDENLVITFNGEIYNYIELKAELALKGHAFKSNSDTEVILAAYQEWGESCQLKFNGMWAFAIWNIREQSIFLSRDRFGVKPLYYVLRPGGFFAFASESIAFKSLPEFKKEMDPTNLTLGIRDSFYLEQVGETIYTDLKKLLPGHSLRISKNKNAAVKKWWRTEEHLVEVPKSYEEQVERFRELFMDSCKLRLRSDVPIGIALSGGLDSSAVYSTIQQLNKTVDGNWKNAFIACFPDTGMDEKQYADEVINFTKGVPNYIYPDNTDIADLIYQETKKEDFIYLSPPVVHNIYKEMRKKGVVVSLDGHGADEMLFGYPHMIYEWIVTDGENAHYHDICDTWAQAQGISMLKAQEIIAADPGKHYTPSPYRKLYNNYLPQGIKQLYRRQRYKSRRRESWFLNYTEFKKVPGDASLTFEDQSQNICYREVHQKLPTLLRNWDRAAMQHGVEIRMPFMDWRLMTYVFSLPQTSKLGGGYTKRIVRDAMKGWMPESIRLRKNKVGINAPMEEWFNGKMAPFVLDIINSKSFLNSDVWNGPLIQQHIAGLIKEKKLTQKECSFLWPYLNAWILAN